MATLKDHQFELDGVAFGLGLPVELDEDGLDTGTADWTTQDKSNPVGDGRAFGRDMLGSVTWGFDLFVNGVDPADALAKLQPLANAWRMSETKRRTPGATSTLRYAVAGRTRRIYGRPRKFSAPPNNRILTGLIPVSTDFACVDHLFYDDDEQSILVPILPATTGGLTSPLTGPIRSLAAPGPRQGTAVIDGDEGAPVTIVIHGPIAAPWVSSAGWNLTFASSFTLAYDQSVTITAANWGTSVLRSDGASFAGKLTRSSTRLSDVRMQPGTREVLFGGIDATATATCTVRWRPAWTSM